jgi:hypothetical protein
MNTIIEELEEQVETWRQRAEAAEAALGMGDHWHRAVPPLSLQMTRIMRLLSARPLTSAEIAEKLITTDYPNTSIRTVLVRLCQIRQVMPAGLMPMSGGYGKPYIVRDPEALKAFLWSGQLPQPQRRAA